MHMSISKASLETRQLMASGVTFHDETGEHSTTHSHLPVCIQVEGWDGKLHSSKLLLVSLGQLLPPLEEGGHPPKT